MAKASDCGSEDRGFESHYPPHKNRSTCWCFFFYGVWWVMGLEESGPPIGRAKKCPVDTFLARGRVPCASERTRMGVGGSAESGRCGQPARPGRRSVPLRLDNAVSLTVRLRCTRRCFFFYGIRWGIGHWECPAPGKHSFPGADCLYPRRTSLMSIIQNPASSA